MYDANIAEMRRRRVMMLICESKGEEERPTVPYQKIAKACKTTGLSQYFLRQGCKNGTIPHVKSGEVYYINVPALMERLDEVQTGRPKP